MTGGYTPMAVVIIDGKIGRVFSEKGASFIHGFTMEGNPVSATACLTVLDIIEKEGLVERSASFGEYFFKRGRAISPYLTGFINTGRKLRRNG
jgi:2,2-dialkylglycine decarboxylase (pyruvate)